MISYIKKTIAELLYEVIASIDQSPPSKEELTRMIEYPPDISMGDLAFPCFRLSKLLKKAPSAIAGDIAAKFVRDDKIKSVSAAGGYLNFTLEDDFYVKNILSDIFEKKDKYGASEIGTGKTAVIDYSSPNMSRPLGVAHLRSTNIGNSIKKIHQFCGYKTIAINYIGDWGTPHGKILAAYKLWCDDIAEIEKHGVYKLLDLYVKFGAEAEKDESLNSLGRAWFAKLEGGDEEALGLWKKFMEISVTEIKRIYEIMGIEFDSYNGESFFEDKMPAVVEELKQKGLLKLDHGAQIVDLDEFGMPPCLILKSDGATLYPTRDIASAIYRAKTYNFDKNIYVTDMRQSLHFAQWITVAELMGYDWANNCVSVPFGLMNYEGEVFATRRGNTLLLDDLLRLAIEKVETVMQEKNPQGSDLSVAERKEIAKKVGVGAVMFSDLQNGRLKDVNFSWESALDFKGNSGPYVQYTYARICGILEKIEKSDSEITYETMTITNIFEREIISLLSQFPEKVLAAEKGYEPSVICRYLLDLCAAFNRFYDECSVLKAESEAIKNSRLALCEAVRQVLGNGLWLIGLEKTNKV